MWGAVDGELIKHDLRAAAGVEYDPRPFTRFVRIRHQVAEHDVMVSVSARLKSRMRKRERVSTSPAMTVARITANSEFRRCMPRAWCDSCQDRMHSL